MASNEAERHRNVVGCVITCKTMVAGDIVVTIFKKGATSPYATPTPWVQEDDPAVNKWWYKQSVDTGLAGLSYHATATCSAADCGHSGKTPDVLVPLGTADVTLPSIILKVPCAHP
jgi:hypothetical protein